jgi:hypothetical protein
MAQENGGLVLVLLAQLLPGANIFREHALQMFDGDLLFDAFGTQVFEQLDCLRKTLGVGIFVIRVG